MKRIIITMVCALSLSLGTPVATVAAPSQSGATSQTSVKKPVRKSGTKKTATAKKYVPASYGDCFIGKREHIRSGGSMWCEITFYPNGSCELKTESDSLKGTFTGTVTGAKYKILVKFSNGEEYDFIGNKMKLVADDGIFRYVVNAEQ